MFGNSNIHGNEEKALLAILRMQDTSASHPSTRIGWDISSTVPYCEWEGVKCGSGGATDDGSYLTNNYTSIVELNLSNAGLGGTLPPELGLLTNLEYLSFAGNMLRGTIPTELYSQLTKLITLNLTDCYLTGILPQTFASAQLVSLLLANNAISGRFFHTANSPHLASIREIRMEDNLLTGTLHGPTVSQMTNLISLSLSNNDLSGLLPASNLGSITSLRYVYLDSNSFVGPLSSSLATSQQQTSGAASILELWLQDNLLSGTVPASYAHFDKMHSFYIDGNKLTGELPQDLCGPEINVDFFKDAPTEAERNYCDSIACPAGSVALEGVYPCSRCPGGEAARLHNRYLGQTGECVNYTDRDVLQLLYIATTKGGPWNGMNDWNDMTKSVCEMTGIKCDVHGRVTSIKLKGRGLEGHIPKEIGSLTNLELFDVSNNRLMGYLPSDLRWTSITSLDISGNRIRGLIPPLLCMIDGLNGNGHDGAFYCDRIACPSGTYNSIGRLDAGGGGEACMPCIRHTSPFLGQKSCTKMFHGSSHSSSSSSGGHPLPVFVRETVRHAGETTWALAVMITTVALIMAMVLSCVIRRSEKYWQSKYEVGANNQDEVMIIHLSKSGDDDDDDDDDHKDEYKNRKQERMAGRSTVYRDYRIAREEEDLEAENNYHDNNYDDDDDDDDTSRTSGHSRARSAMELINDHQGISLRKSERMLRTVVSRVAVGDMGIGRRAREAASTINVSARRLTHSRSNVEEIITESSRGPWSDDSEDETLDYYNRRTDLVSTRMKPSKQKTKVYQSSDLLDIPIVT